MQSRISTPIDINAESLHRSGARALLSCSTGSPLADVISSGRSSSSHPPGNRETVTSYHGASTLNTPSSTELSSTSLFSLGPQYSVTLALAVGDVLGLLITNEGRSSSMPASHPLCQQIRGASEPVINSIKRNQLF
jgi:hypothetical protein